MASTENVKSVLVDFSSCNIVFSSELKKELTNDNTAKNLQYNMYMNTYDRMNELKETIANLSKKDFLTFEENETLKNAIIEHSQLSGLNKYAKLAYDYKVQTLKDMITCDTYDAYNGYLGNTDAFVNSLVSFFKKRYNMNVTRTTCKVIVNAFGVKLSKVKNMDKSYIEYMNASDYAELFVCILLELAVQKNALILRVAKASAKHFKLNNFVFVPRLTNAKNSEYRERLYKFNSLGSLDDHSSAIEIKAQYKKTLSKGIFIEY